jgi:glycerol-3-phosphate acyltransferase PlsY
MCFPIFLNTISITVAYLVGAVPTGYLFAKYFFNLDITELGSGNIGATNVARVLGKRYFALVFLIDFLKAFLTLYTVFHVCSKLDLAINWVLVFSSVALLLGNAYSIFLNFNGGKGVSTLAGVLAYLFELKIILVFVGVWIAVICIFRKPFLASILATYSFCFAYYFFALDYKLSLFYFLIFACMWVTFRHLKNIREFK